MDDMTEALVPYTARTTDLGETMQLGDLLAKSGFFADSRSAAQAVVKVLAGREIGFGPIASMVGVNIIQGRISLSAMLMAAAIKRSGRYDYRVQTMTPDKCVIEFRERSGDRWEVIGTSEFTKADAVTAGTKNMDKYARNMLFARAMSNGARWYTPDIFGGPVYTPEELGAAVDGETGEVIDAPARPVVTATQPTNGAQDPEPYQPEPGEDVWADWRSLAHAKAWAMTQGKFEVYNKDGTLNEAGTNSHLNNAYDKIKTDCAPKTAREMWRCWYEYVLAHEPAKTTTDGTWEDVDAHGHDADAPQFN